MAALAYLLLPLSGTVAFLTGGSARSRFHGLQAIVFGSGWAVALYAASAIAASVTTIVALVGATIWLFLGLATAVGRDPQIPLLAPLLWKVALPER